MNVYSTFIQNWKQVGEWINKLVHSDTRILLVLKKNQLSSHDNTQKELKLILISEISQCGESIQRIFTALKILYALPIYPFLPPQPLILLMFRIVLPFPYDILRSRNSSLTIVHSPLKWLCSPSPYHLVYPMFILIFRLSYLWHFIKYGFMRHKSTLNI